MDLEVTPEPAPEHRDAIERALQKLLEPQMLPPPYASAWRRAGIAAAAGRQRSTWTWSDLASRPGATTSA